MLSPSVTRTIRIGSGEAPATGQKTVTAQPAELFAGASRRQGRSFIAIANRGATPVLIGPASVTRANGWHIPPGGSLVFELNPAVDTPIYAVSSSGHVAVDVMEA